jgi:hypothetical protein
MGECLSDLALIEIEAWSSRGSLRDEVHLPPPFPSETARQGREALPDILERTGVESIGQSAYSR